MEPNTIVDVGDLKEVAVDVAGPEIATETIGTEMAIGSFDSTSAFSTVSNIVSSPTTKATDATIDVAVAVPVAETTPVDKEAKAFLNIEDIHMQEASAVRKMDELADATALLPTISNNIDEDKKSTDANIVVMGASKPTGVEGKEEQEMNDCIEETKAATTTNNNNNTSEVGTNTAEVVANMLASTDIDTTTDTTPIQAVSSTISNNEEEEVETPTPRKKAAPPPPSSPPRKRGSWFPSKSNKINNDSVTKETTTQPLSQQQQQTSASTSTSSCHHQRSSLLILSSLPIDSLHSIASFLTPLEWKNFGLCSRGTNKICRDVFRRVRMHGFRCATEIIMAWKFGQHADAKELCALYVSSGVPIYPHSFGHSYHTLIWRFSIEAKHLQEQQQQQTNVTNSSSSSTIAFGASTPLDEPGAADRQAADASTETSAPIDPFYNERDDLRMREEFTASSGRGGLTYLEEKSLYNLNAKENESGVDRITRSNWRRMSIDHVHRRAMNPLPGGLPHLQGLLQAPHIPPPIPPIVVGVTGTRTRWNSLVGTGRDTVPRRQMPRSNSFSGNRYRAPKISLKMHRHLLDQHLLGRPGVNDGEGSMTTPSVSLSADFFHPFFSFRSSAENIRYQSSGLHNSGSTTASLLPTYYQPPSATATRRADRSSAENIRYQSSGLHNSGSTTASLLPTYYQPPSATATRHAESIGSNFADYSDSEMEGEMVYPRSNLMEPSHISMAASVALQPPPMVPQFPPMAPLDLNRTTSNSADFFTEMHTATQHIAAQNNILSNIDLDVYSASSRSLKLDNDNAMGQQVNSYLKARFGVYQRCLDSHVSNNDSEGFEESIMDFWDEFLPQTANIQYYDKHTAVPRISCLDKFLTKPCPKAIGIVQCEIERVKLGSKKKGVKLKGRFFPTYEYRLFIRHRPSDPTNDITDTETNNKNKKERRDTVLMTAKNRSRKHTENTGQAAKKGSNNYFLNLPQQDDLDLHYKSVNILEDSQKPAPNGIGSRTSSSEFSGLLGRLQSNFVGTEFQIFTPRSTMAKTKSLLEKSMTVPISPGISSDDDVLYENERQSEFNSSSTARRRSRFRRLSLRGRSSSNGDKRTEPSEPLQPHSSPLTLRRSRSGDATPGRNRKVSAAESFESHLYQAETQPLFVEEEDGAITYTANLLGSRPRIMDVCIPKVNPDGAGMEWKRYLKNCKDHDAGSSADRLLNHLKQLQQNGEMDEHGRLINPANNNAEVLGTDEQEYSPPGDFGLLALQNRPPWWNVELGSFVLNFGGRVSVASVKNFQLCDRNDQDYIMLQFGRIEGRHSFTMDFQYPLTAVQAFAIAISSLQSKISFG